MSASMEPRKAVVVGAGPVGCLAALSLANMGWSVEVYEGREDMRKVSAKAASLRSINLAISARGICALDAVAPEATKRFLADAIPMKGRMIHTRKGEQKSQLYDRNGQCINSIDRGLLNEGLLEAAISNPKISVFFEHKLTVADFDKRTLFFKDEAADTDVEVCFDLCVGADGSYSNVRRQLMRVVRMDFEQTYIPHEYLELRMPAAIDSEGNPAFAIDPNHLHIWPRHSFMLIALPNKDKTFTCTLFAPTADLNQISDPQRALDWFGTQFPDALRHIGRNGVVQAFQNNPRSPLIAVKANPYHYKDRAIFIGDAAHSMVPFFGQGLNCGLEDVRVLDVILREQGVDPTDSLPSGVEDTRLSKALRQYTEARHRDLIAISDLAMANYVEMRHSVATPSYLFFRALDNLFSVLSTPISAIGSHLSPSAKASLSTRAFPTVAPSGWLPLYTMVTFRPDISYSTAQAKARRQHTILVGVGQLGLVLGAVGVALSALKISQRFRAP